MSHAYNVLNVNAGRCMMLDKVAWTDDLPMVKDGIHFSTMIQGSTFNN